MRVEVLLAEVIVAEVLLEGQGVVQVEPKELFIEIWAAKRGHVTNSGLLESSYGILDEACGAKFRLLVLKVGLGILQDLVKGGMVST